MTSSHGVLHLCMMGCVREKAGENENDDGHPFRNYYDTKVDFICVVLLSVFMSSFINKTHFERSQTNRNSRGEILKHMKKVDHRKHVVGCLATFLPVCHRVCSWSFSDFFLRLHGKAEEFTFVLSPLLLHL